ncbi:YeeE/YedE family protein [Ravibacter arvi]|uniref:YeeE/YedE family protein n=1 Tax=Ravibacter arvi TaxID=2051041 RepID=A0ABP8LY16_9BACT
MALRPHHDLIDSDEFTKYKPYHSGKSESGYRILYVLLGIVFGIVFVKAEIVSWYRIQEMFRFDSFHMYGVIGSAVAVGMLSVQVLKRLKVRALNGETISIAPKIFHKGNVYGSILFGIGWAITGACPGPLFAQIGAGYLSIIITLLSALLGTWMYGYFRNRLPH